MGDLGSDNARRATPTDDPFLFDVFCSTLQHETSRMPDVTLVQHFLRIQDTVHNQRCEQRFPGYERWVVLHDGEPAGRLFVHRGPSVLTIVEITLLSQFRGTGIGTGILEALLTGAAERDQSVCLRAPRHNTRAAKLYNSLGFRLVTVDDQDSYFEWAPAPVAG